MHKKPIFVQVTEWFLAVTLAIMVVAVFSNVVLRYGFKTGLPFYEELARLLFVWLVCIGAILASAEGTHLGLDMVISRLQGQALIAARWVSRTVIAACLLMVIHGSWGQVVAGQKSFSPVMNYPLSLAAASTLVMALAMLVLLINEIRRDPWGTRQPARH